ncbi:hypothetical protein RZS08_21145, partial [Arthrospira platensis SPKY1]|nr:hypothetical protein [Arthrospira platensis SPKY1]
MADFFMVRPYRMNIKSKIAKKSKLGPGSTFYNTLIVINFSRGRELLQFGRFARGNHRFYV